MNKARKILVIRNDKLGDFMLAWPALSLLKKQYPNCSITVLVPPYTETMAKLCPWMDDIILDDQHTSLLSDARYLAHRFRQYQFDTSISLYTEMRTALAVFLAHIPVRVSPATRLAQIFSNQRLVQRRSKSAKPEHEYNTDLVRYFIELQGDTPVPGQQPPYLQFETEKIHELKSQYIKEHNMAPGSRLIIIHPGSGGSAINFSVEQYAKLIQSIAEQTNTHFIITAGPGEDNTAQTLSKLIPNITHSVYISTQGIVAFSCFIAICDLFISGSTGTLHIAGALDIPTVAFYSARRSATALRWQTLNQTNRRIAFSPERHTGEDDMKTIDPENCAQQITDFLIQLYAPTRNA